MKGLTVVVFAIITGSLGYVIQVPVSPISQSSLAPSGWIHLQQLVIPLFENVCEESSNPMICRLSQEFIQNPSGGEFSDPAIIPRLQTFRSSKGFLPKGEIFSEYNATHIEELKIVFEVMCNAKTFDTFYKFAAWARQNLNCGLFVNAIYMAMENRIDMEKLTIPPPYELLPNYFIRKDIIIQGSSLLAGEAFTPSEGVRDEGNAYTLDANYTANSNDNDQESKLAYFREDIGLNSYYFLKMLKLAPWMNRNVDINSRYGEEMYHMIKQLVARYNLERYSNGMPEQDNLNLDLLSDAPYDPMLIYSNGNEFIHRTSPVQLPENGDKALLQTIEANIVTVANHMRDASYNKTQVLNHIMEILITGERSYDTLARQLLGKALTNKGDPTVFEHYMTSLRDPMIWRLFKKIVNLIENSLNVLPPYTRSEVYFPGVEVVNVDIRKLMTNFEYFEFDITEALKIGNGDTSFQVKIGQSRLNHKPFSLKLNISSLVTQKGLVKIYIGPKMMPGEFAKKKNSFALLDCFEINLKRGSNVVTRSSDAMTQYSNDFISLRTLRKKVEDAQFGLDSLPLNTIDSQIRYPGRLSIPKGTPEGLPLQLFVFVAPFMKTTVSGYSTTSTEFNAAILSPSYPLDLTLEERFLIDIPNAMLKDFTVTHKSSSNAGSGPVRPMSYENQPMDYAARVVGQYGQVNTAVVGNQDQYISQPVVNYIDREQSDDPSAGVTKNMVTATGKYYSGKKKEPFDYKSKKVDYKALNKETRPKTTSETPIIIINDNKATDKILLNEAVFVDMVTDKMIVNDNQEGINNVDKTPSIENIGVLKVLEDDSQKKPVNIDNIPSTDNIEVLKVLKDNREENSSNVDNIPSIDNIEVLKVLKDDNEAENLKVIPVLKLSMPQKETSTVYDYIIRTLYDIKDDNVVSTTKKL